MDLNWQNDIINALIRENPAATIGDFARAMTRIDRRFKKIHPPLALFLWPPPVGKRRWPRAALYTKKSYRITREEANSWWLKDKEFEKLEKIRLPHNNGGWRSKKKNGKIESIASSYHQQNKAI